MEASRGLVDAALLLSHFIVLAFLGFPAWEVISGGSLMHCVNPARGYAENDFATLNR
jgi:hypothetical protein